MRRIHSDGNKSNNKNNDQDKDKDNKSNESNSFWDLVNKYRLLAVALATILITIIAHYSTLKEAKKDVVNFAEKLSFAIKKAELTESISTQFVIRPIIEGKINEALHASLKGGNYTIVYGPKGSGKTELVDHTAIGKKGVVKVSSANTKNGIIQSMAKNF